MIVSEKQPQLETYKREFCGNFAWQFLRVLEESVVAFPNLKRQSNTNNNQDQVSSCKHVHFDFLWYHLYIGLCLVLFVSIGTVRGFFASKRFPRGRKISRLSLRR